MQAGRARLRVRLAELVAVASQGAVTVTEDGRTVLAVNSGSNSVAAFAVGGDGPQLLNTAPSAASAPSA